MISMRLSIITLLMVTFSAVPGTAGNLGKANEAYQHGDYLKSIDLYRRALKDGESPAICYYNAANACYRIDSLPRAIVYYRACVRNAPGFLKGHLNLAICYYLLDDLGNCIATLNNVLVIDPVNEKGLLLYAEALRRCGVKAEAAVAYEKCIRQYPDIPEPYAALGELYRDLGDPDEAIRWLDMIPAGIKTPASVHLLLSDLYEQKGDSARAIYELERAFDADTTARWVIYRTAQLQEKSGNRFVALATCKDGLSIFPDFADMAALAGSIAFDCGLIDEAENYFAKGAALGSALSQVGLTNVRMLRSKGNVR